MHSAEPNRRPGGGDFRSRVKAARGAGAVVVRPDRAGYLERMKAKVRKALLVPLLLVFAFGIAGCGASDDPTTETGSATETTEPESDSPGSDEPAEGAGSTESESAPSGEARKAEKVEIVEFTYVPDPVVVQAGGKVTWQNEDAAPHTATADDGSFDTGTIDKGKIGSETFKEPGTFTYFCTVHPDMHGTVEVVE